MSYALTPSMEVTVTPGFSSVTPCSMCATHSHPARVDNGNWWGAVATMVAGPNCCDIVLATNLRTTSPTTMPRTPPSGFLSAVILPALTMSTTTCGTWPLERFSPNWKSNFIPWTSDNKGLKWSLVIPDGPPATLLLGDRRFFPKNFSSNWKGVSGSKFIMLPGRGARGLETGQEKKDTSNKSLKESQKREDWTGDARSSSKGESRKESGAKRGGLEVLRGQGYREKSAPCKEEARRADDAARPRDQEDFGEEERSMLVDAVQDNQGTNRAKRGGVKVHRGLGAGSRHGGAVRSRGSLGAACRPQSQRNVRAKSGQDAGKRRHKTGRGQDVAGIPEQRNEKRELVARFRRLGRRIGSKWLGQRLGSPRPRCGVRG